MAEITKIKTQKNKKRVNIYLDGKFGFGLDADNFLKAGLKIGQKLSEEEVESLIFENEFQKLLDKAYRVLSLRPRSEKEIQDYLAKKGATSGVSRKIIKKLKKLDYLNDQEFSHWWIGQRSTFRPRGKMALRLELRQKGIKKEIVDKAVEKVDELSLARKATQKKLKAYQKLTPQELRNKLSAYLARRGFSWSTIKSIIDQYSKKE
jgi:regulatory protein